MKRITRNQRSARPRRARAVSAAAALLALLTAVAGCGWLRLPDREADAGRSTQVGGAPVRGTQVGTGANPGGTALGGPAGAGAGGTAAADDATRARLLAARAHVDRSGGAAETRLVTVHFIDALSNLEALQPVEVRIPRTPSVGRAALEALFAGAPDAALNGVPGNPRVRGLTIRDGRAIVDVTGEVLAQRGGSAWEASVVWPIVYTLTELPGVTEVELRVEGKPQILHQMELDRPLRRPAQGGYFRINPLVRFAG